MSHELRTPFSSFFGLLSLLSETPLNREQADFVSTARGSCEVLLDIINSLLDYSKLEAGVRSRLT
jgi:signal transduction histidine kinase